MSSGVKEFEPPEMASSRIKIRKLRLARMRTLPIHLFSVSSSIAKEKSDDVSDSQTNTSSLSIIDNTEQSKNSDIENTSSPHAPDHVRESEKHHRSSNLRRLLSHRHRVGNLFLGRRETITAEKKSDMTAVSESDTNSGNQVEMVSFHDEVPSDSVQPDRAVGDCDVDSSSASADPEKSELSQGNSKHSKPKFKWIRRLMSCASGHSGPYGNNSPNACEFEEFSEKTSIATRPTNSDNTQKERNVLSVKEESSTVILGEGDRKEIPDSAETSFTPSDSQDSSSDTLIGHPTSADEAFLEFSTSKAAPPVRPPPCELPRRSLGRFPREADNDYLTEVNIPKVLRGMDLLDFKHENSQINFQNKCLTLSHELDRIRENAERLEKRFREINRLVEQACASFSEEEDAAMESKVENSSPQPEIADEDISTTSSSNHVIDQIECCDNANSTKDPEKPSDSEDEDEYNDASLPEGELLWEGVFAEDFNKKEESASLDAEKFAAASERETPAELNNDMELATSSSYNTDEFMRDVFSFEEDDWGRLVGRMAHFLEGHKSTFHKDSEELLHLRTENDKSSLPESNLFTLLEESERAERTEVPNTQTPPASTSSSTHLLDQIECCDNTDFSINTSIAKVPEKSSDSAEKSSDSVDEEDKYNDVSLPEGELLWEDFFNKKEETASLDADKLALAPEREAPAELNKDRELATSSSCNADEFLRAVFSFEEDGWERLVGLMAQVLEGHKSILYEESEKLLHLRTENDKSSLKESNSITLLEGSERAERTVEVPSTQTPSASTDEEQLQESNLITLLEGSERAERTVEVPSTQTPSASTDEAQLKTESDNPGEGTTDSLDEEVMNNLDNSSPAQC